MQQRSHNLTMPSPCCQDQWAVSLSIHLVHLGSHLQESVHCFDLTLVRCQPESTTAVGGDDIRRCVGFQQMVHHSKEGALHSEHQRCPTTDVRFVRRGTGCEQTGHDGGPIEVDSIHQRSTALHVLEIRVSICSKELRGDLGMSLLGCQHQWAPTFVHLSVDDGLGLQEPGHTRRAPRLHCAEKCRNTPCLFHIGISSCSEQRRHDFRVPTLSSQEECIVRVSFLLSAIVVIDAISWYVLQGGKRRSTSLNEQGNTSTTPAVSGQLKSCRSIRPRVVQVYRLLDQHSEHPLGARFGC
mmetsp:Transcript_44137/g.94631  ORF Transcript_44137/g.94631 Transcript_44137/m.94631 type:complete len:297 (+) Transcript_44137:416-1306(+)